jgi:hypothetical protein
MKSVFFLSAAAMAAQSIYTHLHGFMYWGTTNRVHKADGPNKFRLVVTFHWLMVLFLSFCGYMWPKGFRPNPSFKAETKHTASFLNAFPGGLTLSSTRTPPALSSALSLHSSSSASFSASVQAGPVSFLR